MEYISTRNNSDHFSFKNVFLKGLADDGGLFIPLNIKKFDESKMNSLKKLNYIEFLRDYGKHFSINRLLSMESVKQRLDREQPLSFLEFNWLGQVKNLLF